MDRIPTFTVGKYTKLVVFAAGVVAYAVGQWFGVDSDVYRSVLGALTAFGIFQGTNQPV